MILHREPYVTLCQRIGIHQEYVILHRVDRISPRSVPRGPDPGTVQDRPKAAPERPKRCPRSSQKEPQETTKSTQERTKGAQEHTQSAQEHPRAGEGGGGGRVPSTGGPPIPPSPPPLRGLTPCTQLQALEARFPSPGLARGTESASFEKRCMRSCVNRWIL